MSADSGQLAPSRDPAAYGRVRILSPTFWAMISLCVLCVLAGAAIATFAPRLWPAKTPAGEPSVAAPAAESIAPPTALPAPATASAPPRPLRQQPGRSRRPRAPPGGRSAADRRRRRRDPGRRLPLPGLAGPWAVRRRSPGRRARPAGLGRPHRPAPLARAGAPTRAALAAELGGLAARASAAARRPGKDASVASQILYAVSRVIDIRRVDGTGGGADAAIDRAQRQADAGDLAAAIAALDRLPPPPASRWPPGAPRPPTAWPSTATSPPSAHPPSPTSPAPSAAGEAMRRPWRAPRLAPSKYPSPSAPRPPRYPSPRAPQAQVGRGQERGLFQRQPRSRRSASGAPSPDLSPTLRAGERATWWCEARASVRFVSFVDRSPP